MTILITTLLAWIVTSVLSYGWTFAYYQRKYPDLARKDYSGDMTHSILISSLPFAGFIVCLMQKHYKYGVKFF